MLLLSYPLTLLRDIEVPKKVMLLHNPTAGASHPNAETLLKGIRKAIGVKPSYFSIKNADWKDALSKRWDAVILAGGRHCRKERAPAA